MSNQLPTTLEAAEETQGQVLPLPYHAEQGSFHYVIAADGNTVALCDSRAQQEFVIRACNSHVAFLAALEHIAAKDCQVVHHGYPTEFTCLDVQRHAKGHPGCYGEEYGAWIASGAARCVVCVASAAVDAAKGQSK